MRNLLPCALAALLPLAANAQTSAEGYAAQTRMLPTATTHVLTLGGPLSGAELRFDGTTLTLTGFGAQRPLLTFPTPVFGSFLIDVDGAHVLLGESSGGALWLVPLNAPAPSQPLANVPFNYDAAMLTPNLAVVSAKTGGFGAADNDLIVVDVLTGTTRQLAAIPGASGPVTVAGALYYATASQSFPTPPGQTSILRFPRPQVLQALSNNQVLGPAQAQVLFSGLDSASDILVDPDDDLLFVDWLQNVVGEIDDIGGPAPTRKDLIAYPPAIPGAVALQFVRSGSPAEFEPFQHDGGRLRIFESDFAGQSLVRVLETRSADLSTAAPNPIPTAPFTLHITAGPRNGAGLVAIGLAGPGGALPLRVVGFEPPLFWHTMLYHPVNTHFVSFDASGSASLALTNPGFDPSLAILTQAAFLDAPASTIGATQPLGLRLSQ